MHPPAFLFIPVGQLGILCFQSILVNPAFHSPKVTVIGTNYL